MKSFHAKSTLVTLSILLKMHSALLSRIGQNLIVLSDYSLADKITIAQKYILPKLFAQYNIKVNDIKFDDEIIHYIIKECIPISTKGIRELKGVLTKVIRILCYYSVIKPKEYKFPTILDKDIINKILHKNMSINAAKYII